MSGLTIGFAGTPQFAATILSTMIASGQSPVIVLTQPDRKAGRGRKLQPSPVKQVAVESGIAVHQPGSLKDADAAQCIVEAGLDVLVVAAYGLLLPQSALDIPRFGCLNVHASVLPRWRGASPIQSAILAGDEFTGVTIMQMDVGLDTGPMISLEKCSIAPDDTAATLTEKLTNIGAELICSTLREVGSRDTASTPQPADGVTYAGRIAKNDGLLDFGGSAIQLERQVRAYTPWPVAFFDLGGERIRVHTAQAVDSKTQSPPGTVEAASKAGIDITCAKGSLRLTQVQRPGGKPGPVAQYLNTRPLTAGTLVDD
jgi:methionyl-tRNA formyltransferase